MTQYKLRKLIVQQPVIYLKMTDTDSDTANDLTSQNYFSPQTTNNIYKTNKNLNMTIKLNIFNNFYCSSLNSL